MFIKNIFKMQWNIISNLHAEPAEVSISNLHAEPAEAPTLKSEANSTFSTFEASAKKISLQNTHNYLLPTAHIIVFYISPTFNSCSQCFISEIFAHTIQMKNRVKKFISISLTANRLLNPDTFAILTSRFKTFSLFANKLLKTKEFFVCLPANNHAKIQEFTFLFWFLINKD